MAPEFLGRSCSLPSSSCQLPVEKAKPPAFGAKTSGLKLAAYFEDGAGRGPPWLGSERRALPGGGVGWRPPGSLGAVLLGGSVTCPERVEVQGEGAPC